MTEEEIRIAAEKYIQDKYSLKMPANELDDYKSVVTTIGESKFFAKGDWLAGYKKAEGEYKADAESWRALEEKLTDCNLSLHDKGKSIELLINKK